MLRRLTEAQLEHAQAELRGEQRPDAPEIANAATVLGLGEAGVLFFRGRAFRVPPVGYREGVRLQQLADRLAALALAAAPDDEQVEAIDEMIAAFARLAHPVGWRGWLRALLPNPFRHASEVEVGQLLAFFSHCRTRSSVRLGP